MGMNPEQYISFDGPMFAHLQGRNPIFGEKTFLNPNDPRSFFASGQLTEADIPWAKTQMLAADLLDYASPWASATDHRGLLFRNEQDIINYHANRDFAAYVDREYGNPQTFSRSYAPATRYDVQQNARADYVQQARAYGGRDFNYTPPTTQHALATGRLINNPKFLAWLQANFDRYEESVLDSELDKNELVEALVGYYGGGNLEDHGYTTDKLEGIVDRFIEQNKGNRNDELGAESEVSKDDLAVAEAAERGGPATVTIDNIKFLSFLRDNYDSYAKMNGNNGSINEDDMLAAVRDWNRSYGQKHGMILEDIETFDDSFENMADAYDNWWIDDNVRKDDINVRLRGSSASARNYR